MYVTVNPVPDAPIANDDVASTNEDTTTIIDVLANDTDADGDELTVIDVLSLSGDGVTTDGTTITYTPRPNAVGTQTISYEINDSSGLTSIAKVTITLTGAAAPVDPRRCADTNHGFYSYNRRPVLVVSAR